MIVGFDMCIISDRSRIRMIMRCTVGVPLAMACSAFNCFACGLSFAICCVLLMAIAPERPAACAAGEKRRSEVLTGEAYMAGLYPVQGRRPMIYPICRRQKKRPMT